LFQSNKFNPNNKNSLNKLNNNRNENTNEKPRLPKRNNNINNLSDKIDINNEWIEIVDKKKKKNIANFSKEENQNIVISNDKIDNKNKIAGSEQQQSQSKKNKKKKEKQENNNINPKNEKREVIQESKSDYSQSSSIVNKIIKNESELLNYNGELLSNLLDFLLNIRKSKMKDLNSDTFSILSNENEIENDNNAAIDEKNNIKIIDYITNYVSFPNNNNNNLSDNSLNKNIDYAIGILNPYNFNKNTNYLFVISKYFLKQKRFQELDNLIKHYSVLFTISAENTLRINLFNDSNLILLELKLKLVYAEFLKKLQNYKESQSVMEKILFLIINANNFDNVDMNKFSYETFIFLINLEIKLSKIMLLMKNEINYFLHLSDLINLIEFFEKKFMANIDNNDLNNKNTDNNTNKKFICEYMILKRKYKKLNLTYNMINNLNEIEINFELLKEILEIDAKYLAYTKYSIKDILLLQKLFFEYVKIFK